MRMRFFLVGVIFALALGQAPLYAATLKVLPDVGFSRTYVMDGEIKIIPKIDLPPEAPNMLAGIESITLSLKSSMSFETLRGEGDSRTYRYQSNVDQMKLGDDFPFPIPETSLDQLVAQMKNYSMPLLFTMNSKGQVTRMKLESPEKLPKELRALEGFYDSDNPLWDQLLPFGFPELFPKENVQAGDRWQIKTAFGFGFYGLCFPMTFDFLVKEVKGDTITLECSWDYFYSFTETFGTFISSMPMAPGEAEAMKVLPDLKIQMKELLDWNQKTNFLDRSGGYFILSLKGKYPYTEKGKMDGEEHKEMGMGGSLPSSPVPVTLLSFASPYACPSTPVLASDGDFLGLLSPTILLSPDFQGEEPMMPPPMPYTTVYKDYYVEIRFNWSMYPK